MAVVVGKRVMHIVSVGATMLTMRVSVTPMTIKATVLAVISTLATGMNVRQR